MKTLFAVLVLSALVYLSFSQFEPLRGWAEARLGAGPAQAADLMAPRVQALERQVVVLAAELRRLRQSLPEAAPTSRPQAEPELLPPPAEVQKQPAVLDAPEPAHPSEPEQVAGAPVAVDAAERNAERRRELAGLAERLELRAAGYTD